MSSSFQLTTHTDRQLDETIQIGTGPYGIHVCVLPRTNRVNTLGVLSVRYGARDLSFQHNGRDQATETPPGIAHFLEHELFKKENRDTMDQFSFLGASANAMTDYSNTTYYFITNSRMEECLPILFETVYDPYFSESFIEQEKKIIQQELMMYMDQPNYKIYRAAMNELFRGHPLGHEIGGTPEDIEQIDVDLLRLCHDSFYQPGNTQLILAGNLDRERIFQICEEELNKREWANETAVETRMPPSDNELDEHHVELSFGEGRPKFILTCKNPTPPEEPNDVLQDEVTETLMLEYLFGNASPARQQLIDDNLVDDSFSFHYYCDIGYGFSMVSGDSDDPNEVLVGLQQIIDQARNGHIDEERVKSLKKGLQGQYIQNFDSLQSTAFWQIPYARWDISPFDFPEVIQDITPDDILKSIQTTFAEEYTISVEMHPDG